MALKLFIVLIFAIAGVIKGESASVEPSVRRDENNIERISEEFKKLESIESLSASKILMDHTSLQPPLPNVLQNPVFKEKHYVFQSVLPLKMASKPVNKLYNSNTGLDPKKSNLTGSAMTQVNKDIESSFQLAQCKAACFKKITIEAAKTKKKMRLDKETIAKSWKGKSGNIVRHPTDQTKLFSCLQVSKEFCSCWKICQLLQVTKITSRYLNKNKNNKAVYYRQKEADTETVFLTTDASKITKKIGYNSDLGKSTMQDSVSEKPREENKLPTQFDLKLVSLIRQNSLVIAELRWDKPGQNPEQEYQVTWELSGGALKGHLVTDSTSVTLSLWPDATYTIQVETFENSSLDSDGEKLAVTDRDPPTQKSLPLTVDTRLASFPLEAASALLSEESESAENKYHEEDKDSQDYNKFIGKVLVVLFASLVLVLVILSVGAFLWIKLRYLFASKILQINNKSSAANSEGERARVYSCFNFRGRDKKVIDSQEYNLNIDESPSSHYSSSSPYVFTLDGSVYSSKKKRSFDDSLECSVSPSVEVQHQQRIIDQENFNSSGYPYVTDASLVSVISHLKSLPSASCFAFINHNNNSFHSSNGLLTPSSLHPS